MKVKELHLKEQEKQKEEELSFAEWLEYFKHKPTNNENYSKPLQGA